MLSPGWQQAQVVATWVTAAGIVFLVVGAVIARSQVKAARSTLQAATALSFAERWNSPVLVRARQEVADYPDTGALLRAVQDFPNDPDGVRLLLRVPDFLEELGVAESFGWVPLEYVVRTWGPWVPLVWQTWWPTIDWLRQPTPDAARDDRIYGEFQRLQAAVADAVRPAWKDWWAA